MLKNKFFCEFQFTKLTNNIFYRKRINMTWKKKFQEITWHEFDRAGFEVSYGPLKFWSKSILKGVRVDSKSVTTRKMEKNGNNSRDTHFTENDIRNQRQKYTFLQTLDEIRQNSKFQLFFAQISD